MVYTTYLLWFGGWFIVLITHISLTVGWVKPNSCVCDVLSTSFLNETRLSSSLASLSLSTPKKAWRCLEFLLLEGAHGGPVLGVHSVGWNQPRFVLFGLHQATNFIGFSASHLPWTPGWWSWEVKCMAGWCFWRDPMRRWTHREFNQQSFYGDILGYIYPAIYGIWMCPTMGKSPAYRPDIA